MRRVIKDKFGCILAYSEVLAKRKDCTVIEDYKADAPVKPKPKPRKPRAKKADPKPPVGADALGVLDGLDTE